MEQKSRTNFLPWRVFEPAASSLTAQCTMKHSIFQNISGLTGLWGFDLRLMSAYMYPGFYWSECLCIVCTDLTGIITDGDIEMQHKTLQRLFVSFTRAL